MELPISPDQMWQKQEINLHFKAPRFVKTALANSALGLITAFVFDIIHPVSAAIFSASHSIMQSLLWPGTKELLTDEKSVPTNIYIYVVSFIFSSIVSIAITVAVGFPMNFLASVSLAIFMVPTSLIVNYLFNNYAKISPFLVNKT